MSNTIKLKRGSGSDPSASDLSVGEIAIRTDSGKLFTKKDNGSVAEISGSGGIDDGDKGDITVSNGGDTFTIDNGVVTSAKIANGTIVNADINASAAIAGSKITPTFTSNIQIQNENPEILLVDTGDNPNFKIENVDGLFALRDTTNSANRLTINSSGVVNIGGNLDVGAGLDVTGDITTTSGNLTVDGTGSVEDVFKISDSAGGQRLLMGNRDSAGVDCPKIFNVGNAALTIGIGDSWSGDGGTLTNQFHIAKNGTITSYGNHDFGAGIDVTGNITVTGTVDGIDISDFHAQAQSFFNNNNSGVLTNGVTATTQSAGNNTTRVATTAFVSTAIANLVDSAPGTLNTLNELAAALGDDANFSTTVTNSIATKLPLAGGTLTGNLAINTGNSTNDLSATNIFRIMGNDVRITNAAGSEGMIFAAADGAVSLFHGMGSGTSAEVKIATSSTGIGVTGNIVVSGTVDGRDLATDGTKLDGIESNATADQTASEILTLIKTVDGAGSGLDADTLDGISSASFLRSDAADTCSQPITFSGGIILPTTGEVIKFGAGDAANDDAHIEWLGGSNAGYLRISTSDDSDSSGSNEYIEFGDYPTQNRVGTFTQHLRISRDRFLVRTGSNSISQADRLNIASDGTVDIYGNLDVGAGLDVTGNISVSGTVDGRDLATDGSKLDGIESGATADQSASEILTLIKTVDGAGSGLDADTLDGISSASFLRSDTADTMTGNFSLHGNLLLTGDATTTNQDRTIDFTGFDKEGTSDTTDRAFIRHTTNTGGHGGSVLLISSQNDSNDGIAFATNSSSYLKRNSNTIWDAGNDGSGSGLDADLLDGVQGSSFLRSDANDTSSGVLTLNRASSDGINLKIYNTTNGSSATIEFSDQSTQTQKGRLEYRHTDTASNSAGNSFHFDSTETSTAVIIDQTAGNSGFYVGTNEVWHAGNDGSGSGLDADTLDGVQGSSYLRSDSSDTMSANLTITGRLDVGDGSGNDTEIRVFKADNNVSDHIQFYNGTTRVGEIGCKDTTWLRINQDTAKNIYTPRYIRADAGFFVDGTSKGINGSGNFIGGTIAGASDYGTLVRSNASDTLTGGTYTFDSSTDQKIILQGSTNPYIRFKQGTTEKAFIQWNDSTNSIRLRNQEDNAELRIKDDLQFSTDASTFYSIWHAGNDGSGSGLDSDTVDGIQGASLLRSDANDNVTGHTEWQDNYQVRLGNGADMRLYHNATDSYIDNHVGHIYIRNAGSNDNKNIYIQARDGEHSIICEDDADVRLFSDNTEVFRTDTTSSCKVKHLYPWSDSAYDLGTSSNRFRNIYGDTLYGDGSNLTGISAGATGGGSDEVFYENDQTVTTNYTITNGKNAMAAGPITINSGVTVTVGSGENLTIV